ncbi:MAG: DUF2259 domain-containing protein [Treponemataceae bacterium]
MKKQTLVALSFLFVGLLSFAGDVAQFVDLGFSADGNYYAFAQHGLQDNTFRAYAEIQIIDVKRNDYLQGGILKMGPSAATRGRKPAAVYYELFENNAYFLSKTGILKKQTAEPIYMLAPNANPYEKSIIEFRDFPHTQDEGYETTYLIHLDEKVQGTGKNAMSSYSLIIEQRNEDNIVLSRTNVGSNRFKRPGIVGYRIYRILASPNGGGNIAVVLEQLVSDENGISVRYMVEAISLGNF